MKRANGVYRDISSEEYDEMTDRANWSIVKHAAQSMAHVKQAIDGGADDDNASLKFGRAGDMLIFEPKRFAAECVLFDGDGRTAEGKAFKKANSHLEILSPDEWERCHAVAKAVRAHPLASKYLGDGGSQVTILWDHVLDDGTKLPCKARLDHVSVEMGALVDLKTTVNAHPEEFRKSVWKFGYHGQGAMYVDGCHSAGGILMPYVLVAVEKTAPYPVLVRKLSQRALARGRAAYRSYLEMYARCMRSGIWPGYAEEESELDLPYWTENLADGVAL